MPHCHPEEFDSALTCSLDAPAAARSAHPARIAETSRWVCQRRHIHTGKSFRPHQVLPRTTAPRRGDTARVASCGSYARAPYGPWAPALLLRMTKRARRLSRRRRPWRRPGQCGLWNSTRQRPDLPATSRRHRAGAWSKPDLRPINPLPWKKPLATRRGAGA